MLGGKFLFVHLISSQSLNLGGRLGTTDDVATIPFLGSVIARDRVDVVGHSLVFQILLQIEVRMSIMASPSDFPIFIALTVASTSSRRIG